MKQFLIQAINRLAKDGKIFCSEADFQFSLAWELQKILPSAEIYLEKGVDVTDDMFYIDIVVRYEDLYYYIELKYHTSLCVWRYKNSQLFLKEQSAQDLLRYDYLKDIYRLLTVSKAHKEDYGGGYAVVLTNDRLIYDKPRFYSNKVLDFNFRIHERSNAIIKYNYPIPGIVKWNNGDVLKPDHWTKVGPRKDSFFIPKINTEWEHYFSFRDNDNIDQVFKFLTNEVCITHQY